MTQQSMRVQVTKEFTFDAAHHLLDYAGPCANMHGHTYKLQVTVEGEVSPETGMIMDFNDLKSIVKDVVIAQFDHKCLNDVLDYNPTAENMVMDIISNLQASCINAVKVRLWETPTSYATAIWNPSINFDAMCSNK